MMAETESVPASAPIDREAVRVLAVAIGVREAARKLGLSEDRVCQWSKRGKWFQNPAPLPQPPTVTAHLVSTVSKPGDVMLETLADDSKATRIGLSQATRRAVEHLRTVSGAQVLKVSKAMRDVAAVASTVHGWEEKKDGAVVLNLGISINNVG